MLIEKAMGKNEMVKCPECKDEFTVIPGIGIMCWNCQEFVSLEDIRKEIEKRKLIVERKL